MWSHYADTPGETCFLFINATYIIGSVSDGIRKQRIEVRFGAINVWQNAQQLCGRGYIFLIMILPDCKETFSPVNLNDGARPMWAE